MAGYFVHHPTVPSIPNGIASTDSISTSNSGNRKALTSCAVKPELSTRPIIPNEDGVVGQHLPNPGSPISNAANSAVCPTLDQRGYGRSGISCDKGAAEFGGIAPTAILTKTHYFAGAQLIAMREITTTGTAGTLYYLHQDHLGKYELDDKQQWGRVCAAGLLAVWRDIPYRALQSIDRIADTDIITLSLETQPHKRLK